MGERFRGVLSRVCTPANMVDAGCLPCVSRLLVARLVTKCMATSLQPLCLVSERVDHQKRGLYGSIVGWHIGLFVRHM